MSQKHIVKSLSFLIFVVFFLSFSSATGLEIIGKSNFSVDKVQGADYEINLTLKNPEAFNFYNITPSNNILQAEKFNLEAGQTKTIFFSIKTDSEFDGIIKLQGFYQAQIGQQNLNHEINVNYDLGISDCQVTIIKGDSITWKSSVSDQIILRNYDTGNDVSIISANNNYTSLFDSPQIFSYYFLRWGFIFTDICRIDVLNTEGFINNPEYDASINLDLDIAYEPTELSATFLSDSYILDFNDQTQDIFSIKNVGSKEAKNIKLQGDWFTFTENNFNLNPGQTKNIGYTLTPYIFETSETNKTYNKEIKIIGNFQDITKNFSVFINYENLDQYVPGNLTINDEIIKYLLEKYCSDHPNEDICKPRIIYKEGSNKNVTVTYTEEQIKELWAYQFEKDDERKVFENSVKETNDDQNSKMSSLEDFQNKTWEEIRKIADSMEGQSSLVIFLAIFLGTLFCLGFLIYFISNERVRKKITKIFNFHKGEKTW